MLNEPEGKFEGGMRIIEGLREGIDLAQVINDIARDRTYYGVQMYAGAVQSLMAQFLVIRKAGLPVTSSDKAVNDVLQRPPFALAAELTRLMNGGDATREQFREVVSTMVGIVWQRRLNFTHKGKRLAIK